MALGLARFKSKIKPSDTTRLNIRVWITDVDVSVMNHAAIMTVFEMGRADFMVRLNFFQTATKNKWFIPNQSISVQFYRPLKVFQKAKVYTKIAYVDATHFYIEQVIERNGKKMAACFSSACAKQGMSTVPTDEITIAMGASAKDVPVQEDDLVPLFKQTNSLQTRRAVKSWDKQPAIPSQKPLEELPKWKRQESQHRQQKLSSGP